MSTVDALRALDDLLATIGTILHVPGGPKLHEIYTFVGSEVMQMQAAIRAGREKLHELIGRMEGEKGGNGR